ncbi:hypothetical protein KZ498_18445 [Haloarcula sp. 1CSR25-25]|jgi:hypothetical protein|uniref:hypothetical protein n=1 Tax=Halobellus rufus TaxID=1448860 RepID=UPI000678EFEA|nr:hypothetical protein [Halobellus rufus]MDT3436830.1 hypothetical protein [Haloarcula sp. 1CSR25-25]
MLFVLVLGSGVAGAHEVAGSRFDSPLPLSLLFAGAGATVALTALWLAVTERSTTPTERRRQVLAVPSPIAQPLRYGIQGLFLVGVAMALVLGFVGRQVAAENFATVFTWPVWFRGVALLAILLGNPWRTLSPWRTIYRGLVWLEGRTIAVLGTYPSVLGGWPAIVGFLVLIGIIENLTVIPRSPRLTTVILAVYALVMVGGATLYGTAWFRHADPLEVFYRLFGRVAPIDVSSTDDGGYTVALRPPWRGCLDPVGSFPLIVFAIATVYTVSFDGFTNTRLFQTVLFGVRDALGTGSGSSVLLYAVGLAGFVVTFGIGSWVVERLGAKTGRDWIAAARWFAPTVLPIAAAYEVAHNYPYVIRNLGQLIIISVRWVSPGVESVSPLGWLSLPLFWGSQVVLIVVGHVIAVVAAHYVAVRRYDSPAAARRGHLPLVVLMVGYTVLSLWIISQPVVSG